MRKDLEDINQSLRNDVLEAQEEYADLFGMDPYEAGCFLWGCIYEQIEAVFMDPAFARQVINDLILNVMGDDRIAEDAQAMLRVGHMEAMKEELTVDEALADFGRKTKRIALSGDLLRLSAMMEMLQHHTRALGGIMKTVEQMLQDPSYLKTLEIFLPELGYNPEHMTEAMEYISREVHQRLVAHRRKIRKAAEIIRIAMEIQAEKERSYGLE